MKDNVNNIWASVIPVVLLLVLLTLQKVGFALLLWLCIAGIFIFLLMLLSWSGTKNYFGFLIDERNKISLSRLQFIIWVLLILSGFLAGALWNILKGETDPLGIAVGPEIWIILGIATISMIASPLIKSAKEGSRRNGTIQVLKSRSDARLGDILMGEDESNFFVIDIAKIQLLFFTMIFVTTFAIMLFQQFLALNFDIPVKVTQLPTINQSLLTLFGISHAGYLMSKAIPRPENDQIVIVAKAEECKQKAKCWLNKAGKKDGKQETKYERYKTALGEAENAVELLVNYCARIGNDLTPEMISLKENAAKSKKQAEDKYTQEAEADKDVVWALFRDSADRYLDLIDVLERFTD